LDKQIKSFKRLSACFPVKLSLKGNANELLGIFNEFLVREQNKSSEDVYARYEMYTKAEESDSKCKKSMLFWRLGGYFGFE
jgi:hypothetical protein